MAPSDREALDRNQVFSRRVHTQEQALEGYRTTTSHSPHMGESKFPIFDFPAPLGVK